MNEARGFRGHLTTAIIGVLIAVSVLLVLFRLTGSEIPVISSGYTIRGVLPQAGSLTQGSSVTMAGARVGNVLSVKRRGVGAEIKMKIDEQSVTPLPRDSRMELKVRTALGEGYVEIAPGRSKETLAEGDLLTMQVDDEYVEVDQILSQLQGGTRKRARVVLQSVGRGLEDRGEALNSTLGKAASLTESGPAITNTLDRQRQNVGLLIEQLGDVAASLGERGATIDRLARDGLASLRAIAERDDSLRATLEELPSTLAQVRTTTGTLGSTADTATPVVENLAAALGDIRPAVTSLAPAAREGRRVVRELSDAAAPLEDTLQAATEASGPLARTLPGARRVLCQANPALRYLEPYTRDILSLPILLGAASNAYDAIGHTIRLMPLFTEQSLAGTPPEIEAAQKELRNTGLFQQSTPLSYKPYPEPGEANYSYTGDMEPVLGPDEVAESGYEYPRIKADC